MKLGAPTRWFLGLIDYRRLAEGPPPKTLGRFFLWALKGSWPPVILATVLFAVGGLLESVTMWLLGKVIDATAAGPGAGFWADNRGLAVTAILVLLVLRPLSFGLAGGFQSIAVMPNLFGQVMSRLNRHTLGQSVSFFDDDIAGGIAQKQM